MIDYVLKFLDDLTFKRVLLLLFLLNIFDAFATLFWVTNGIAAEANPIMHEWLNLGSGLFLAVKLSLVSVGIYFLWAFRDFYLSKLLAVPALGVYCFAAMMHVLIAFRVIGG